MSASDPKSRFTWARAGRTHHDPAIAADFGHVFVSSVYTPLGSNPSGHVTIPGSAQTNETAPMRSCTSRTSRRCAFHLVRKSRGWFRQGHPTVPSWPPGSKRDIGPVLDQNQSACRLLRQGPSRDVAQGPFGAWRGWNSRLIGQRQQRLFVIAEFLVLGTDAPIFLSACTRSGR